MQIVLTQNALELFEKFNVPSCHCDYILNTSHMFPIRLKFNVTYYKYAGGVLTAFRILAYAAQKMNDGQIKLSYLVQLPNDDPKWILEFIKHGDVVFNSKEQFFAYQTNPECKVDLEWACGHRAFPDLAYASVIGLRGKVWNWDNHKSRAVLTHSPNFTKFMVCADGLFIYVPCQKTFYLSQQECLMTRFNGMEVVEFDEEPDNIEINVRSNTAKIHTLRFIEE